MNYTPDQITKYANLVCFTADPASYEAFAEDNKKLAKEVTKFHIEATILESIQSLSSTEKVTYLGLRDHMRDTVFKGIADVKELERKMDQYLPQLAKKKLITKKMKITKLGKSLVSAKKLAFIFHNVNPEITS